MKQDAAQAALKFLERVQLQGQEVDAYQYVRSELRKIAFAQPREVTDEKPAEATGTEE
jgi:hypothetical protein